MIHPSYRELMDKINEENAAENIPGITSRYSVVLATSKRAREITNGAEPLAYAKSGKALSIAVEEFYEGKVRMNPEGHAAEEETGAGAEDVLDAAEQEEQSDAATAPEEAVSETEPEEAAEETEAADAAQPEE